MNKFGGWKASFSTTIPEKVVTAVGKLNGFLGADYKDVAYLGYQEIGTMKNHAVLVEQTLVACRDIKNVVVLTFSETGEPLNISLSGIRHIAESGGQFGGTKINCSLKIPEEVMDSFKLASYGWVGTKIEPVVYLGKQSVSKGVLYKLIAKTMPVGTETVQGDLALVTVNSHEKSLDFQRVFELGDGEPQGLAYKIIKGAKVQKLYDVPLGEWP